MACGGGNKKKIILEKKDLFDFKMDFPGGGSTAFSRDTSAWKIASKFPSNAQNANPAAAQNPPEAKKDEKKPELDISTTKIEKLAPYDPKADEEALLKEKEEKEKEKTKLITSLEAKKEELDRLNALLQEQEQNIKKNQKEYLITEIKNEILVNMTVKQNAKYEKVVKEITNRV